MAGTTTRPPPRIPTHSDAVALPSLDALATAIASMERELWELSRAAGKSDARNDDVRDMLIELVGRDGRAGVIRELREAQRTSAESQGRRIGELELALSRLAARQASAGTAFEVTRGQLAVLAVLGLAVLGAAIKFLLVGVG